MNTPLRFVKSGTVAALSLLAAVFAVILFLLPANAGLSLRDKAPQPSFVVYSAGPGEHTYDDAEQGFSAMFIDALVSAVPDEDVALTIRRMRANAGGQIEPAVEDSLEGTASLRSTSGIKKALLVAVEKYEAGVLTAPVHHAKRLDKVLQGIGYQTEVLTDPDQNTFALVLDKFVQGLKTGDQALFYFNGRGFDLANAAYLLPRDEGTPMTLEGYKRRAIPFETVQGKITKKARNAIFIVDIDRSELGGSSRVTR